MEFFDEDDKLAADILIQLSEQVPEHQRRTCFLPTWGSKALRSVLVNIPPPYKSSPPIVPRPSESNAVPRLPQSLPSSSSNPRAAPARLRLKIKSPGAKRMRTDVPLGGARSAAVEEAVNCGREGSESGMGVDRSNETMPLPNGYLMPKESFVMGGATSLLVEESVNCGRQVLEGGTGMEEERRRGFPNGPSFIPKETFVMGYIIQFNKSAVYAEARKRRKLHMQRVKNPSRLCS